MKTLSVLTTTYNRDYCINQLYKSLLRQTSNDFLWLIIDDGSTDNTKKLVDSWIKENKIEIEYYYKQNGGMHTARNMAYDKCHTLLNVIIDSDDWMTDNAVEKIINFWYKFGSDQYYGIVANDIDTKGGLIGSRLPDSVKESTMFDLFHKYRVKGDKKIILRNDLSKLNPFPEFFGEKFYPPGYKYLLLDQKYKILLMNEPICVVDYNEDSMTFNKFAQYKSCANGFAHYRNEMIKINKDLKFIIREMIHYIAECKFAKKKHIIKESSKPFYAFLIYPLGLLYYYYLNNTKKKY